MRVLGLAFAAAMALSAALPASASVTVSVAGDSRPWDWVAGGLNDAYQFGGQDGSGPTIVSFASAGITAGGSWAVIYKSGITGAFAGPPVVDQNGYVGSPFKDNDPGSSGNYFPSHYTPTLWSSDPGAGVFLNALVFVFTDDSGQIVGTPDAMEVGGDAINGYFFVFGKGGTPTPAGATRLQLGLNDDLFFDNSGALQVCVGTDFDACSDVTPVPEPATWSLLIAGFAGVGALMRRRRSALA